ncbi:tRNA (5-methylaminomethyl-2-thiouridine)(34)-methyltransferase MnmD [Mucilaginibacter psychrotolerans]|uniref:tRNA (5-methylaminomethyl-2-thiouridylate)-methyltransferase n=1 Tax=Mucilaginibacter psychrotolerans TaxID=1524096 RepID=A0A4Y8SAH2_9SPHI|nr:tRNA (5-methylaminomethyl-2-thiouridine)(34)-methyltransferase MnmD [Mucilaginibacter psychrotolerans]TFF35386.1 tRNA (5-methylaminomethyl-2-thiouridylate)-methyltransferase [Mucilaginibacter psychrotolerans]
MDANQQPQHLSIVATADGSNTIYNAQVGENYHSRNGALQESRHVFLQSGLVYFLLNAPTIHATVSILEVGFGTGLNFLLSADYCAAQNIGLDYTGIEASPLSPEMIAQTGYDKFISATTWNNFLQTYPASLTAKSSFSDSIQLQTARCPLLSFSSTQKFDIIYFDAFAAAYQPEMWDEAAINHTLSFLKPGGVFVTYAITGNLKRMVKALGLKVEKAPGAPGKREMLRAVSS